MPQQAAKSITLNYTTNDAVIDFDYTIHIPRTIWKSGYKYTYALQFTPTEITVTPSVSEWDNTPVEQIFD